MVWSWSRRRWSPSRCRGSSPPLSGNSPRKKCWQLQLFVISHLRLLFQTAQRKQAVWLKNRCAAISSAEIVWYHKSWSFWEAIVFVIIYMGLLPYGRKEKDEKEQRVQRMQRTPHGAEFDPESLSDPPDLRWLTHWLVGLAGEYLEGRAACNTALRTLEGDWLPGGASSSGQGRNSLRHLSRPD